MATTYWIRCCVTGCFTVNPKRMFPFVQRPKNPSSAFSDLQERRFSWWVQVLGVDQDHTDKLWICYRHFSTGQPAAPDKHWERDWVPNRCLKKRNSTDPSTATQQSASAGQLADTDDHWENDLVPNHCQMQRTSTEPSTSTVQLASTGQLADTEDHVEKDWMSHRCLKKERSTEQSVSTGQLVDTEDHCEKDGVPIRCVKTEQSTEQSASAGQLADTEDHCEKDRCLKKRKSREPSTSTEQSTSTGQPTDTEDHFEKQLCVKKRKSTQQSASTEVEQLPSTSQQQVILQMPAQDPSRFCRLCLSGSMRLRPLFPMHRMEDTTMIKMFKKVAGIRLDYQVDRNGFLCCDCDRKMNEMKECREIWKLNDYELRSARGEDMGDGFEPVIPGVIGLFSYKAKDESVVVASEVPDVIGSVPVKDEPADEAVVAKEELLSEGEIAEAEVVDSEKDRLIRRAMKKVQQQILPQKRNRKKKSSCT